MTLTVGRSSEVVLPPDVRARYGFAPEMSVRLIETRLGVMMIPLKPAPPSEALANEIADWQKLAAGAITLFPR